MLGLEDNLQDPILTIFIENVTRHLKAKLKKDVPEDLNFIIEEIVIRRFNRVGTEGMKSESVEGHSITFYDLDKEFDPYQDIIDDNKEADADKPKRGKVFFI